MQSNKSIVELTTKLERQLLSFPFLVNKHETKDPTFLHAFTSWLKNTEQILLDNNQSAVSELSALRAKIYAESFSKSQIIQKRKYQIAVAGNILYEVQQCVQGVLAPRQQIIDECRYLLRQLIQFIAQAKVIKFKQETAFDIFIADLWLLMCSSEQLKPSILVLKSKLSINDIQLLIAAEVDLEEFSN